eukprot:TRINITY_DN1217_c0_g2_i8.p1 TRINITY_DN1217_c0_g2~~TRINITY_DN1217_c0_g2_i8.p1  ORF type:complete len:256 (-),score=103.96 TRINITY_DN1217_c0_g2_i8:602-1369(-)
MVCLHCLSKISIVRFVNVLLQHLHVVKRLLAHGALKAAGTRRARIALLVGMLGLNVSGKVVDNVKRRTAHVARVAVGRLAVHRRRRARLVGLRHVRLVQRREKVKRALTHADKVGAESDQRNERRDAKDDQHNEAGAEAALAVAALDRVRVVADQRTAHRPQEEIGFGVATAAQARLDVGARIAVEQECRANLRAPERLVADDARQRAKAAAAVPRLAEIVAKTRRARRAGCCSCPSTSECGAPCTACSRSRAGR